MCVCTTIRCWKSVKAFKLLIVNSDSYFQFQCAFPEGLSDSLDYNGHPVAG